MVATSALRSVTSPLIVGSFLIGSDKIVSDAMSERLPHLREGLWPCTAFGFIRDGRLVGGVAFNNYRGFDVHMSAVLDCAMTRSELRVLCDYVFGQLGCKRATAVAGKKNKKARKALEIVGFTLEGVLKRGFDGFEDAMIFGLLKEHCKWIKANG